MPNKIIGSEKIATIRDALQVIQLIAQNLNEIEFDRRKYNRDESNPEEIKEQVKRIDKLLPERSHNEQRTTKRGNS